MAARDTAVAPLEWSLPYWSPAGIRRAQRYRLRAAVSHAHKHVPYYKETMRRLGLRPEDFAAAQDLAKLPILERGQVQRDPEYFVSRAAPLSSYAELFTSGSTGEPLVFFRHVPSVIQSVAGFQRMEPMLARLSGRRWHRREALVLPPSTSTQAGALEEQVQWLGLHQRVTVRIFSLFQPPAEIAAQIDEFRPHLIRSYGSYIEALYCFLASERRPLRNPKVLTFVADPVSEPVQEHLRNQLGIALLSVYQAVEGGVIAWQCERQGAHHLNVDLCPTRLVDPDRRDVRPGEAGQVVISNLVNRGTVLLNYLLGDVATALPGRCECGRSLPLLSGVEGRTTDWLQSNSGRPVHPQALRAILRQVEGVRRYQLVQTRPGHVRIVIVAAPGADQEEVRSRVLAGTRSLAEPIDAEVQFSETLPRTQGGKVRTFLRHGQAVQ